MIVPVRDGGAMFRQCLAAIKGSPISPHELIVVDDGSRDESAGWAASAGATVIKTATPGSGPAIARNLAATRATGDLLFFCDADVQIQPDTLEHIQRIFTADPGLTALFGSYDDQPGDPGFLSQYRNLFHHYVHQHASEDASTFWSGCGIIRRDVFLEQGGFASRYQLPSIEDIELGCLVKQRGGRIRLDKTLQVKHLKRWTLKSMLRSDIIARGIPWTLLIFREGAFLNDLNLQTHNRVSVVTVYLGLLCMLAGVFQPLLLLGALLAALALLVLNRHLYQFFAAKRGPAFALKSLAPHWLYYFYNGISFSIGALLHLRHQLQRPSRLRGEYLFPALATLLLATLLRFHNLGAQSMWLDELLEIGLARRGLAEIWANVLNFGAMPLDYFATFAALQLGEQDFWLRVAPALWSVLTVAVMYRFAGRLVGRPAGLTAALFLAAGAFHIRYAQETRPYALFGLLALCSFHFLFRALKTNRPKHWLGYALSGALSLLAHYFTLFMLGAQALAAAIWLLREPPLPQTKTRILRFGLSVLFVISVLAVTPYFDNVLEVGGVFVSGLFTPTSFAAPPELKPNLDTGPVLDRAFFVDQLLGTLSGGGDVWRWAFLGLAVLGLGAGWRRHPRVAAMVLIAAVVPVGLTIAFLIHRGTFFAVRYIMPSYLALIILITLGATAVRRAAWVVVAVAVTFSLMQVNAYYGTAKEDWRLAAKFIDASVAPGDRVNSPLGGGVIFHYTTLADAGRMDTTSTDELATVDGRLWVVVHPYIGPAAGAMKAWLAVQPSAVEYRIDDSLSVFVVDKAESKADILASVDAPETATAAARLAEQYATLGDVVNAEANYQKAVALGDEPRFKAMYADYLRQAGRGDEAAQLYLAVLDDDPTLVAALVGMGRIYLERGLPGEAVLALERAVTASPSDYAANFFLAQAYGRLGNGEQAAHYFEQASKIVPDLIEPP
jgi:glycosyltransferase involved in cell wall biosynthesis